MTEERKQELRQLLNEAMEDLAILPFSGYSSLFRPRPLLLPVNLYRKHLQQRWASYLRDYLSIELRFYPDIVNEATKSKLLDFIREELAPFIEEDEIGSSSYRTEGETVDGFRLDGLRYCRLDLRFFLEHLLKIAIARGVEEAVSIFDRFGCPEGTHGFFQSIVSLEGIRLETEIQVCERVRLVPFSRSTTPEIWSYLSNFSSYASSLVAEDPPIGKTLLIIDRPAFSIFHRPSPEPFQDGTRINDLLRQFELDGEKFPNSSAVNSFEKLFCQALSLACNSAVQIARGGWFLAEYEFFQPGKTGGITHYLGPFGDSTKAGKAEIDEAKRLYEVLVNLDSNIGEKLQIPIDRWIKSKTGGNPIDKIIDLGIALEALYIPDGGSGEITFKLAARATWHLGRDKEHRKKLKKEFTQIYDWRSKAVHTGALPTKKKRKPFTEEEVVKFIQRAQHLCRQSIMKILEEGKFPEWNDLILG